MPTIGSSSMQKKPVRMSKIFAQMLLDCPFDIQVYGKCVADIRGGVQRHACEHEFQKMRLCFERGMHKRRG
ncbi:hypothetical protein PsorP6_012515 [Peronosclerospora sorghi]|uniref:Uncharacterized protein n=1 Tax=Peronosclerospora sorghi TaxID=230839 RepID=A0ACC0WFR8_9STRA|nr:hypothetical protein PsorP6_012515 [Peronosclerospora sorghi]